MTRLLSTVEAAEILGMRKNAVIKLLQRGSIRGFRSGHAWKIPEDRVLEYATAAAVYNDGVAANVEAIGLHLQHPEHSQQHSQPHSQHSSSQIANHFSDPTPVASSHSRHSQPQSPNPHADHPYRRTLFPPKPSRCA